MMFTVSRPRPGRLPSVDSKVVRINIRGDRYIGSCWVYSESANWIVRSDHGYGLCLEMVDIKFLTHQWRVDKFNDRKCRQYRALYRLTMSTSMPTNRY